MFLHSSSATGDDTSNTVWSVMVLPVGAGVSHAKIKFKSKRGGGGGGIMVVVDVVVVLDDVTVVVDVTVGGPDPGVGEGGVGDTGGVGGPGPEVVEAARPHTCGFRTASRHVSAAMGVTLLIVVSQHGFLQFYGI